MLNKKNLGALIVGVALLAQGLVSGPVVFAQGDTVCSGGISGETVPGNPNAGVNYFGAVDANGVWYPVPVPLDIVFGAGATGFAPSQRQYAACTDDADDEVILGADEFIIRGFSWNDNLGFISYYCDGASGDGLNEGVSCGTEDYSVVIGPDVAGTRELQGYAWNSAFGYINFYCSGGFDGDGNACGPYDYGVTMDSATGDLSGYGFSQAGVYIDFSGVNVRLPEDLLPPPTGGYCEGRPYVCFEVTPDPDAVTFADLEDGVPIADGDDGYTIDMYLREADGVTPLNTGNYEIADFYASLDFDWIDTVKLNQLPGATQVDLSAVEQPWREGRGGVVYKPIDDLSASDFVQDPDSTGDLGHYRLRGEVTANAPTSNANASETVSFEVPFVVKNELFLVDLGLDEIAPNDLILERVNFELIERATGNPVPDLSPVAFPNGKNGLSFKFRPGVEISTLYANDLEDRIQALREVPISLTVGMRRLGRMERTAAEGADVALYLDYEETETELACGQEGAEIVDFIFQFLEDIDGTDFSLEDEVNYLRFQALDLLYGNESTVSAVASLPGGEGKPCSIAQGPAIYSTISYELEGNTVRYLNNKLPRLASDIIANPAAIVYGTVYSQSAYSPVEGVELAAVDVDIDKVREVVDENVKRYLGSVGNLSTGTCVVTDLDGPVIKNLGSGCIADTHYKNFSIGDEEVYYFEDSDLHFDVNAGTWSGNYVFIVDGGNIYFDSDVYNGDPSEDQLTVIGFRQFGDAFGESGNAYVDTTVNNLQMNLMIDGSLFSILNGMSLDPVTGEPQWNSFAERNQALSGQFLFEGTVSSANGFGLSECVDDKNYFILGTGEVLENCGDIEARLRAQNYDFNFFRVFTPGVEITSLGPKDQRCGKALSSEDIEFISDGSEGALCGEFTPCTPGGATSQRFACDGIDLLPFNEDTGVGDLVVVDIDALARGLNNGFGGAEIDTGEPEELGPVYFKYVAPYQDSFVFSKRNTLLRD